MATEGPERSGSATGVPVPRRTILVVLSPPTAERPLVIVKQENARQIENKTKTIPYFFSGMLPSSMIKIVNPIINSTP